MILTTTTKFGVFDFQSATPHTTPSTTPSSSYSDLIFNERIKFETLNLEYDLARAASLEDRKKMGKTSDGSLTYGEVTF